jgi:heme-degrading monooxygenase HmoA
LGKELVAFRTELRFVHTIIDDTSDTFTIINTFIVAPDDADEIVDALRDFTERVTFEMRGFVGASVHLGRDRTRVVNYVQWESEDDFRAMFATDDAKKHMAALGTIATQIDPVVYDVVYVGASLP